MKNNNMVVSYQNENELSYVDSALIACLVSNDLKHIHLHACGSQFDRIHDIAQEYYDKVSEELDYLCELALEFREDLPNLTQAGSIMSEYIIQTGKEYDYDNAITQMSDIISTYLNWLSIVRNDSQREDVQSYFDDKIRYWSKELSYKLSRRSSCERSEEIIDDIDTSNIVDVTETTQAGSIGQHKNTNTTSFPPINKGKKRRKPWNEE